MQGGSSAGDAITFDNGVASGAEKGEDAGRDAGVVTETGASEVEAVTEPVTDGAEGEDEAGAAVQASWCRAARCLLRSLSAGPRCRGRRGGGAGVGEGEGEGGRE